MELKVGEYVRTKQGYIAKVTKQLTCSVYCFDNKVEYSLGIPEYRLQDTIFDKVIVKHSFDIKELVQEGDLIKILEGIFEVICDKSYEKLGILVPNKTCLSIKHSALEYIFSEYKNVEILTKEQYNSMKYIVGGE